MVCFYMLWCILAAFAGPLMTVFEGIVAGVGSLVFACKSLLAPLFDVPIVNLVVNERLCEKFGIEEAVILHGVLGVIGLIECVLGIVGSAFCCNGLCCGMPTHVIPVNV
ncbi:uncharacterized protein LOC121416695 [Lytechinus variegatus]|uniref:uncharacterized protein LOC121416695 n=1 Tax=Lytechinus variegatus TaxID=7654 RepID=UPI001BB23FD6|nr:uncharacterized protein LOC121416695 [Lytechinus variegatus]